MADSLLDILSRKDFEEPPEIKAIKRFVEEHFHESVEVIVRDREIIITSPSAALAGTLRLRVREIQKSAGTTKRLILRIR